MKNQSTWNPEQYKKFAKERDQPFYDLMKMVHPQKDMRIVDLGCGTGELTQKLHDSLKAKYTLGIDTSETMLAESKKFQSPGMEFKNQSIEAFQPTEKFDLIFSNAALQWVDHHEKFIKRVTPFLKEGGQFAFQMPANYDFPTYTFTIDVAKEKAFKDKLDLKGLPGVLTIEQYAQSLYDNGFKEQKVYMQIYGHEMENSDALIEWAKGSILTYYQKHLSENDFKQYLERYRQKIHEHFGINGKVFFPFKRILLWAKR